MRSTVIVLFVTGGAACAQDLSRQDLPQMFNENVQRRVGYILNPFNSPKIRTSANLLVTPPARVAAVTASSGVCSIPLLNVVAPGRPVPMPKVAPPGRLLAPPKGTLPRNTPGARTGPIDNMSIVAPAPACTATVGRVIAPAMAPAPAPTALPLPAPPPAPSTTP
jgi:hypothetical protein